MSILQTIIKEKHSEVYLAKKARSLEELEASCSQSPPCKRISTFGIIAEMKRQSPSKGHMRDFVASDVAREYEQAGAAAISVLTDNKFFGGSMEDLVSARLAVSLPILRKDFVIDRYQIAEARVYGADIILLIAAVLGKEEIKDYSYYAKQLGLEVLVEVHSMEELEGLPVLQDCLVGVNNRNLGTFDVNLNHSRDLVDRIPENHRKVAESGIHSPQSVAHLKGLGYQYFLIGERFMKAGSPGEECKKFVKESGLAG